MTRAKTKRKPNRPDRALRLAASAKRLAGQPMFRLLAKAKELERRGKRILHFEIGEPDFATPVHISRAAIRALKSGDTHYTSSMGTRELRGTVVRSLGRTHGFTPSLDQVLITPANAAIYFAVRVLVNPGEEVIVPDPGFSTYYSVLAYTGARAVHVPLREANGFRMHPADIEHRITPKTRLIIVNSPQNPTGAVMNRAEIAAVANIAEQHSLFL
ncbi:aminotransferase class I/II-fold pyridoxal phosphate-dependent enzyme, partial [Candidatus Parcubacteria bacterium]|nr:aminotransferase class I/II-fold pyridoxal phosphate-dependent enzyme [Candidatus Parcubacteria bacterium]